MRVTTRDDSPSRINPAKSCEMFQNPQEASWEDWHASRQWRRPNCGSIARSRRVSPARGVASPKIKRSRRTICTTALPGHPHLVPAAGIDQPDDPVGRFAKRSLRLGRQRSTRAAVARDPSPRSDPMSDCHTARRPDRARQTGHCGLGRLAAMRTALNETIIAPILPMIAEIALTLHAAYQLWIPGRATRTPTFNDGCLG